MAHEAQAVGWYHTSSVVAQIRNTNLGKNDKPVTPTDVHPFYGKAGKVIPIRKDNIGMLKRLATVVEC